MPSFMRLPLLPYCIKSFAVDNLEDLKKQWQVHRASRSERVRLFGGSSKLRVAGVGHSSGLFSSSLSINVALQESPSYKSGAGSCLVSHNN